MITVAIAFQSRKIGGGVVGFFNITFNMMYVYTRRDDVYPLPSLSLVSNLCQTLAMMDCHLLGCLRCQVSLTSISQQTIESERERDGDNGDGGD